MLTQLDKFRFKTWVTPEPYVQFLTGKIYYGSDKRPDESWFWKEPGHLYCFIYLSLFGHRVHPKYRCLLEAYNRCDIDGTMAAQRDLAEEIEKLKPVENYPFPGPLIAALLLCGVDRAKPKDSKPTRGELARIISGELRVPKEQQHLLTEAKIKEARKDRGKESRHFQIGELQDNSLIGRCDRLPKLVSDLFSSTFKAADVKFREAIKETSISTTGFKPDPFALWLRILAGPHPLSAFEVSWILVHFRLNELHVSAVL